jgi:hypothetical protein
MLPRSWSDMVLDRTSAILRAGRLRSPTFPATAQPRHAAAVPDRARMVRLLSPCQNSVARRSCAVWRPLAEPGRGFHPCARYSVHPPCKCPGLEHKGDLQSQRLQGSGAEGRTKTCRGMRSRQRLAAIASGPCHTAGVHGRLIYAQAPRLVSGLSCPCRVRASGATARAGLDSQGC